MKIKPTRSGQEVVRKCFTMREIAAAHKAVAELRMFNGQEFAFRVSMPELRLELYRQRKKKNGV